MARKATRLTLCFCAVALSFPASSLPGGGGGPDRPNILFILTDDQRADTIGAHGNPYVETPSWTARAPRLRLPRGAHHGRERGRLRPEPGHADERADALRVYDSLDGVPTFREVMRQADATCVTGKWHQSESSLAGASPGVDTCSSAE